MFCMWLAENTGHKNDAKIAIWAPSHNFVGLEIVGLEVTMNMSGQALEEVEGQSYRFQELRR